MKKSDSIAHNRLLVVRHTKAPLSEGILFHLGPMLQMFFLKLFITFLSALTLFSLNARGQNVLEKYVADGLRNNEVLQQKQIGLEKALLSLRIAKGMFMPSVGFQGSYTNGSGGRNISLPVGDMLNPVYTTLNQLTNSQQFAQIENMKQNFFPSNFYDARVRTSVPIFNSDLVYTHKIRQHQVLLQEFEVMIYKRELIKNIKVAYFNYLSALAVVTIYNNSLKSAEEGKRVNESLLANGSGLPAYVLRAESEIENIHAQIVDYERQVHNAQLYFNFLLNRGAEEEILFDENSKKEITDTYEFNEGSRAREELKQLSEVTMLNQTIEKMSKSFWVPKISGFADLGSQYQNWEFNNQSRYYLVGVQLDVPLFAGFTNSNKIRQYNLEVKNSELDYSAKSRQLAMSEQVAKNELTTAYQNYRSAQKQLEAAQSYHRLIYKGYKEGSNTFIETVDARTQLVNAELKTIVNLYAILMARANYEREVAISPID